MAKTHVIQNNFVQGELSPLMGGRYDLDMYNAGLSELLNMVTDSRGGVKHRDGMSYLGEVNGQKARISVFLRATGTFSVLIFTDLLLTTIVDINVPIFQSQVAPWTEDQVEDLYFADYPVDDTIYIFHPNVQTYEIIANTNEAIKNEFTAGGNFIIPAGITEALVCVCGGGGGGGSGTGSGGGGSGVVKQLITVVPGEDVTFTVGNGGSGGVVAGGNGFSGGSSSFTYLGGVINANGGTGGLQSASGSTGGAGANGGGKGGDSGSSPENGSATSAVCSGSSKTGGNSGSDSGGGGGGGFGKGGNGGFTDQFGATAAANTGAGGGGGGKRVVYATGGGAGGSGKIVISWLDPLFSDFILQSVTFVNPPNNWTGTNWPACGVKFQNRLWVGGAPDSPEEFWGSKQFTPKDFDLGTSQPNEAMQVSIDKVGVIKWMQTTKNLVIGTLNYEFVVTSEGNVLIPGDISVENQSSYTSSRIRPEVVGEQIFYVNSNGRKVRAINYEWQRDNWDSVDLTLPSEHITEGIVKEFAWAQDNDNLLWMVLKDGTMACLTYERGTRVFGWHRHITNGTILSADVGFDGTRSVVVLAILRQGKIYIEQMTPNYQMDSFMPTTIIIPYNDIFYVSGFDHLEGMQVQILVDGSVHATRIVGDESEDGAANGSPGRIYLNESAKNADLVVVGIGYRKQMTTLDLDGGAPTGSAAGHMKRRNRIFIKVLDSAYPVINGEQYKDIHAENPMDTTPRLFTGLLQDMDMNWDRDSRVTITQDGPLPLKVLAILGEVAKNAF